MRLAAAELGGHVEDGRRLDLVPESRRTDLGRQVQQVAGQVRPLEEPLRVLVVLGARPVADLVEVDGELRRIQRPALAQVFAGRTTSYQGFSLAIRLLASGAQTRSRNPPVAVFSWVSAYFPRLLAEVRVHPISAFNCPMATNGELLEARYDAHVRGLAQQLLADVDHPLRARPPEHGLDRAANSASTTFPPRRPRPVPA